MRADADFCLQCNGVMVMKPSDGSLYCGSCGLPQEINDRLIGERKAKAKSPAKAAAPPVVPPSLPLDPMLGSAEDQASAIELMEGFDAEPTEMKPKRTRRQAS